MSAALALFNHLLNQHPTLRAELAALAGRRVALSLPPLMVAGVVTEQGWLAASSGAAEATVHVAPLAALATQWSGRAPALSDLTLEGDAELAGRFGHVLSRLRWLPAEDLSRLLGDVATHRLEGWAGRLGAAQRATAERVLASLVEHWRDERRVLVERQAVEQFVQAVDALRDDAARLEKRLARLEAARRRQDSKATGKTPCG